MTVLMVRLDSAGDVLLAGPAVRAVADSGRRVVLVCSSVGAPAARLLPGVDRIITFDAPWVHGDPPAASWRAVAQLIWRVRAERPAEAIVLTSSFQSSIPTALLLRLAGVRQITGVSDDYPGSLLDTRVRVPDAIHEVQRNLAVADAAGYPGADTLELRAVPAPARRAPYVVVHPGADAESRAIPAALARAVVEQLAAHGHTVLVTGSPGEAQLTAHVAGTAGVDLGGQTDLAELAGLLREADALVVGNTGPAHLAASVGTPVISLFPPVVPWHKWRPYGVPVVRLGDQQAACAETRARQCPVPGHPCLAAVGAQDVVDAVHALAGVAA